MTIEVLIAEHEPEFMLQLMKAVASDDSLRIVGSVFTEEAVAEQLKTQQPGLLIIGTNLLEGTSSNVIRQAVRLKPSCGVIVSTMFR